MGAEATPGLGRVRLGDAREGDLEGAGYLFDGYLVADDALLVGPEASHHFGLVLARHGIDGALDRLNGSYRYVVKQEGRVWFGIDHFGGAALFYQLDPELSLFDDPSAQVPNPDYSDAAVCCLLASGFTIDDETIYSGIRECGSGVLYEFETATGQLRQRTWFKFNLRPQGDCDPDELETALMRSLPRLAPLGWELPAAPERRPRLEDHTRPRPEAPPASGGLHLRSAGGEGPYHTRPDLRRAGAAPHHHSYDKC